MSAVPVIAAVSAWVNVCATLLTLVITGVNSAVAESVRARDNSLFRVGVPIVLAPRERKNTANLLIAALATVVAANVRLRAATRVRSAVPIVAAAKA